MQSLTVRNELGVDSFDPMNIDVSEFDSILKSIPADGNVDLIIAPKLAAQFLRAADRCSSILTTLTWHEQKTKDAKKRAYSRAIISIKEANPKMTDTIVKHKAELDTEYVTACERASEAEAVREHFKNKYDGFLRAHHLMKDIAKDDRKLYNASGFSRNRDSEEEQKPKNGEVDW